MLSRSVLRYFFLICFFIVLAAPAFASDDNNNEQNVGLISTLENREGESYDPHDVAGDTGGSRLDFETKLVISPDGLGDGKCRSILNITAKDFFIPWRTDDEWNAFISMAEQGLIKDSTNTSLVVNSAPCCVPTTVDICGTSHKLGQRVAATRQQGEIDGFGAEGDIYGPVSAGIDRQETWGCSQGTWAIIKQSGTCNGIDSACGIANGKEYPTAPSGANLCATGNTATAVAMVDAGSGQFYWTWTCKGTAPDKPAVQCSSSVKKSGSSCGTANGKSFSTVSGTYCVTGNTFLNYKYDSVAKKWTWQCQGNPASENTPVSCYAFFSEDNGKCGTLQGKTLAEVPSSTTSLCTYGTPTLVSDTANRWNWSCQGQNGGTTASCYAVKVPPKCGTINGTMIPAAPSDAALMCTDGRPSSPTGDASTGWKWTCSGNGSSVNCATLKVEKTNGECGSSNDASMPEIPNRNLCNKGTASAVTGTGPWMWSCSGIGEGSSSVTCQARKCEVCKGTISQSFSSSMVAGIVPAGGAMCPVWGLARWTETIERSLSNVPSGFSWHDALHGVFSKVYQAKRVGDPYCEPCFYRTITVTGGQIVAKTKDACGTLPPNSPVSVPITGLVMGVP